MRRLLAVLAAVVVGATGFTGYTMATATTPHTAVHTPTATTVDPTMSAPHWTARPSGYADCAQWNESYAVITFSGVSTHSYGGCVNPMHPGLNDSFTGHIRAYLAIASQKG